MISGRIQAHGNSGEREERRNDDVNVAPQIGGMTKREAIRLKCLECGGGSPTEVTLCNVFECPLWQFRTGHCLKSKIYRRRMEVAQRRLAKSLRELEKNDTDISFFDPDVFNQHYRGEKKKAQDKRHQGEGNQASMR
jgi:hypothetical protein